MFLWPTSQITGQAFGSDFCGIHAWIQTQITIPPDQYEIRVKSRKLLQIAKSALYVRKSLYMMG
ncbi:MAG TPA: hypothetical protein DCY03_24520 [Planctomycetaceae bacterium]|nr:hypothetical protein [Planctomycetaceae bacterium]